MNYEFPNVILAIWRHLYIAVSNCYWCIASKINLLVSGITYGRGVRIRGKCQLLSRRKSDIILGDRVMIESRFPMNPVGLLGPSSVHTLCGGHIEVGDDTGMSSPIISSRSSIIIGKRCNIGGNARIFDHDFHSLDPAIRSNASDSKNVRTRPIVIGDDVFIGTNAIILKGTSIGDRSIVAAGSVVFGLEIPPDSLVKGNPASIINRKDR